MSDRGAMHRRVERLLLAEGRGRRALVVGVAIDGEQHVFGRGPGEAPGADTLFEIGSITKAFTGALLAEMHLRGEVDLSDPLSRHLPSCGVPWRYGEPTLEDLATHRTGLPNTPRRMGRRELAFSLGLRRDDPWAGIDEHAYRREVARTAPRRMPRRRVRYSSLGFGLLGEALARRAGMGYEELLRERILAPISANDTAIVVPPARRDRLLQGYSRFGTPRPPIEDLMPAAGGLRSSAGDMLRWLAACLASGSAPPGPALALAQLPRARLGGRVSIGLGWVILERRRRPPLILHNGGTWGFRSFVGGVPEHRLGVVVLSNTSRSVDRLGFRLIEAVSRGARTCWENPDTRPRLR